MQQQLEQIHNQLGILQRVKDNRNRTNGVNQASYVKLGRPAINPVLINPRRPMMDDNDDEDDFGRMIANPSGKGVRKNVQQHNHWENDEYKLKNNFSVSLELDLEHYVVPVTSTFANFRFGFCC